MNITEQINRFDRLTSFYIGSKQVTEMRSKTDDNKANIKQLDCKKTELEPKVCAVEINYFSLELMR